MSLPRELAHLKLAWRVTFLVLLGPGQVNVAEEALGNAPAELSQQNARLRPAFGPPPIEANNGERGSRLAKRFARLDPNHHRLDLQARGSMPTMPAKIAAVFWSKPKLMEVPIFLLEFWGVH